MNRCSPIFSSINEEQPTDVLECSLSSCVEKGLLCERPSRVRDEDITYLRSLPSRQHKVPHFRRLHQHLNSMLAQYTRVLTWWGCLDEVAPASPRGSSPALKSTREGGSSEAYTPPSFVNWRTPNHQQERLTYKYTESYLQIYLQDPESCFLHFSTVHVCSRMRRQRTEEVGGALCDACGRIMPEDYVGRV